MLALASNTKKSVNTNRLRYHLQYLSDEDLVSDLLAERHNLPNIGAHEVVTNPIIGTIDEIEHLIHEVECLDDVALSAHRLPIVEDEDDILYHNLIAP